MSFSTATGHYTQNALRPGLVTGGNQFFYFAVTALQNWKFTVGRANSKLLQVAELAKPTSPSVGCIRRAPNKQESEGASDARLRMRFGLILVFMTD